jgi:PAS domain S-box-containing protein
MDVMLIIRQDDWGIIDINDAAVRFYGYIREELLLMNFYELHSPEAVCSLQACLAKTKTGCTFETTHRQKDGIVFPVELSLQPSNMGSEKFLFCVVRDITERDKAMKAIVKEKVKKAEASLRESEERYHSILDNADDFVYICSKDYRVEYMNRALINRTGRDATGELCYSALHDSEQVCPWCVNELVQQGKKHKWELTSPKDGRTYIISNNPIHHADGSISTLGIIHDISERKQAEELFKTLSESSPVGVYIVQDGKYQFVNRQFQEFTGYSANELLDRDAYMVVLPEDRETARKNAVDMLRGLRTFPYEFRSLTRNGEIRWIMEQVASIMYRGKRAVLGNYMDISERKQAEERLHSAHRQLIDTIEFLPDATFVIDKDRKVIAWNRAIEEMTGVRKEEIIGKGDYAYGAPFYGIPRPILIDLVFMDDKKTEQLYKNVEKTGTTLFGETFIPSLLGKEAFLWGKASPLYDSEGNLIGAIESIRDITEQKSAEKRLRYRVALEEAVAANTLDMIFVLNEEGVISFASPSVACILGYKPEELIDKKMTELIYNSDVKKTQKVFGKITQKENSIINEEIRLLDRYGALHITEVFGINLLNNPAVDGVIFNMRDVTDRKKLETRLALSQKLESIGQLAAGIAHEINTPMQYISDNTRFLQEVSSEVGSYLSLISELVFSSEKGAVSPELLREIKDKEKELDLDFLVTEIPVAINQSLEGIERVRKIIMAMKDFSHPGFREKMFSDINKAIEGTVTISRNEWKYVAELETDLEKKLPLVYCVISEINQVILNMIINAAHAISEKKGKNPMSKGKIVIRTRSAGNSVKIEISDNGTGIPESIIKKIYDPFFTTKGVGVGTGQGLTIAHDIIVNKHKGTIDVESVVGKGTAFTVNLPVSN